MHVEGQSGRPAYSHVNADGLPKQVHESPAAAKAKALQLEGETGAMFTWYVCGERPEHWHIARVRARP